MAESTECQDLNRSNEPLTTRRQILERAATTIALGLAGLSTGLATGLGVPTPAAMAAEGGEELLEEYTSPDGAFALRYPISFKGFSKPLKTHKVEVRLVCGTGIDASGLAAAGGARGTHEDGQVALNKRGSRQSICTYERRPSRGAHGGQMHCGGPLKPNTAVYKKCPPLTTSVQ